MFQISKQKNIARMMSKGGENKEVRYERQPSSVADVLKTNKQTNKQ